MMHKQLFLSYTAVLLLFCSYGCGSHPVETLSSLQTAANLEANACRLYKICADDALKHGYPNLANMFAAISYADSIHLRNLQVHIRKLSDSTFRLRYDSIPNMPLFPDRLHQLQLRERWQMDELYPSFITLATAEDRHKDQALMTVLSEASHRHASYLARAERVIMADGNDRRIINSWSVCSVCGLTYATVKLDIACEACESPASDFCLFQQ